MKSLTKVIASSFVIVANLFVSEISAQANSVDMHRLYNPNSGEHFYTADVGERNHLVAVGWKYEGSGWQAPTEGADVYRLYNPNVGDHHYTTDAREKDHLVKVGCELHPVKWTMK